MEHLAVKATTTTTDLGQFEAVAAAYGNVDRVGDRIVKGAFAGTIAAWRRLGRTVPLHWSHGTAPEDIIGSVDPASMRETDEGLVVKGQLDLDGSERARQAWRAMRTGSVGLSFGYLVQEQHEAADGANELTAIDLFEVSLAAAPVNASTRVLSMKAEPEAGEPPSEYELHQRAEELGIETPRLARVREDARDTMLRLLADTPEGSDDDRAKALTKSIQPIQVRSFDC